MWLIRLRSPLLAQVLLVVGLFGALGSLRFDEVPQPVREVPQLCIVALFAWLMFSTRFDSRWATRVLLPTLGVLGFILFYAYIFTLRTDGSLLPSVVSQRNYVSFLLGPVVYMLYLRGWRLADFQKVFLTSVLLSAASLAAYDVLFASRSLLLSGSFFQLRLGAVSEQSSMYRLLNTSILFLVVYFGRRLLQTTDVPQLIFMLGTLSVSLGLLAISFPRGLLASVGGALILYAVFLARPGRAGLSFILLPIYGLIAGAMLPLFRDAFVARFGGESTYQTRVYASDVAWRSIREYPLFGVGSDSPQSLSFQDMYGHFYPSDIGLLGVTFQFGLAGLVLYVLLAVWLCVGLLQLIWAYSGKIEPKQATFLWALFIVCLSFLVASPTQARFIYSTGLPIGAFAWGIVMACRTSLAATREYAQHHGIPAKIPKLRPEPR